MKNRIREAFFGKGNAFDGLIALIVVGLFVLGCNCNRLGELAKGDDRPNNPQYPTNTGTAPQRQGASVPTNSNGQLPSPEEVEAIVQETVQDFATGVDGNFSVMYDKSSKGFKRSYTLNSVNTNFIKFVEEKSRIVPLLRSTATMKPYYSLQPAVSKERGLSVLRVNGSYSTSPPSGFELQYVLEDKRWKMIGIRIRIENSN